MMKITVARGGNVHEFVAHAGNSLLDLALANGIGVSYSCRRGDCEQCLGVVVSGTAEPLDATRPFSRDNSIFLCNAAAREDMVLEIPFVAELAGIRVQRCACKIDSVKRLSDGVLEIGLRLPRSVNFEYLAGQFIRLTNSNKVTRSYSLATGPGVGAELVVHIARVANGSFSKFVFEEARAGDLLHLEGPMGNFILREVREMQKTLFIATGTGIAPIHAILASLGERERARCGDIAVYWGNRTRADAYLGESMRDICKKLGASYSEVFSRDLADAVRIGHRHVQELVATEHTELVNAQVFASGNPAMIRDTRVLAHSRGMLPQHFHADPFTAS